MDSQNDGHDDTAEALPLEGVLHVEPPAAPAPAPTRTKVPKPRTAKGQTRVWQNLPPGQPHDTAGASPQKKGPGPNTATGKAAIRLNAVRYGIYAVDLVIPGLERVEDWQAYRAGMLEDLAPEGYLQTCVAQRAIEARWRLNRVTVAERNEIARANMGQTELRLPPSNELDKIIKAEAHLNRVWLQAMHQLEVLQKQRRGEATPLARVEVSG